VSEICGSPDTDDWLKLKVGSVIQLQNGNKLLVVDDDHELLNFANTMRAHYTFASLEDGSTLRLARNKVAFDIFCETWKVLSY
jgi:hypothetical protein